MHTTAHRHAGPCAAARIDRAMAIGVAINLVFVMIELGAGFAADSLALLADAEKSASKVPDPEQQKDAMKTVRMLMAKLK